MCETLGYSNFCSACTGSQEENGKTVCRDRNGKFYGLPVKGVLMAPCMTLKKEYLKKRVNGDLATDC